MCVSQMPTRFFFYNSKQLEPVFITFSTQYPESYFSPHLSCAATLPENSLTVINQIRRLGTLFFSEWLIMDDARK